MSAREAQLITAAVQEQGRNFAMNPVINNGSNSPGRGRELPSVESDVIRFRDSSSVSSSTTISSSRRAYVSVAILCFINLINYMDRYTLAGVLRMVQDYYKLNNAHAGLLQTCFIISYMIMAPVFGYLGDRYSRRLLMAAGVLFWSLTTLLGSFVPQSHSGWFFFLRALVGTGEASYSTVAPTIIADLFTDSARTKMLSLFYFAIPVGSGLGYVVGSEVAHQTGYWYWALRVTPALGVLSVILTLIILVEPPRGQAEGSIIMKNTRVIDDIIQVIKIPSFMWVTLGFTCVTFSVGALAWWVPDFLESAQKAKGDTTYDSNYISLIFGVITCFAGILGVVLGTASAYVYRRYNQRADPLICAYSMLAAVPLVFCGCVFSENIVLSYVLIFLGVTLLCMNWVLVADIVLYVVIPTRRAIASSIQITISHALGDACSPYVVGLISDAIKGNHDSYLVAYRSMEYALFLPVFILVVGAGCFLINSFYIVEDKDRCSRQMHGNVQAANPQADGNEFNHENPYYAENFTDDTGVLINKIT